MKKGFTLLELIIVLTVMSIIAATSFLSINAYNRFVEKKELDQVRFIFNEAKREAILNNRETPIKLVDNNKISVTKSDNGNLKLKEFNHITFKIYDMEYNSSDTLVIFSGSGAPLKGVSIRIDGKDNNYILTVGVASGKVSIKNVK